MIHIGRIENYDKQVYISADYDQLYGDRNVVEELNKWGSDSLHKVDFIDMSKVSSGTVANGDDCRICDLKAEFNRQINASSAVSVCLKNNGNATAHLINKMLMVLSYARFPVFQHLARMMIMET